MVRDLTPNVRILPMTRDAISGDEPRTFFLERVPRRGGVYYFKKRKIASPRGSLVLFQMEGAIIASAVLLETVVGACRNEDGEEQGGWHVFDVGSIRFLDVPVTSDELAVAAPDFRGKRFSQAAHMISGEHAAAIEALLDARCREAYGSEGAGFGRSGGLASTSAAAAAYVEGAVKTAMKLAREVERNPSARAECLRVQGARCKVCDVFDSGELYGIPGIIHVHHVNPLSLSEGERAVDPSRDLVPVCPNCHALIHSKEGGCYTIEEARRIVGRAKHTFAEFGRDAALS